MVAFALRAAYTWLAMGPGAIPSSDAVSYDNVAWNLARGLGFMLEGASGRYPTAFVPPVLPYAVSLLYRAVGHQFFAALLLQCAFGALVPLLVRALGDSLFGGHVGRTAGWLAAVHPLLVFFSAYLLTETLFCLTLLLALLVTAEWVKTPRRARALGAGLLWGLAALTRPTALPLPVLVALWSWWPLGLIVGGRERARQLSLLALGVVLAVGPWTARNAVEFQAVIPVTTGGGRSFLDANNPIVWDDPRLQGGATSVYGIEPYASHFRGRTEHEIDVISVRMARDFLADRWSQVPAMAAKKLARFWRLRAEGGDTGHWARGDSPLSRFLGVVDPLFVWSLLSLPLAVVGVGFSLRGPRRLYQSLPLLVIGAFSLGAMLYWGALRMRVPVEPLVVVYAAAGIESLRRQWRVRRSPLRVVPR
ncbi:MAG: glycosyltransferase family 39 protein [Candidatus Eisenbacteria bacterium]